MEKTGLMIEAQHVREVLSRCMLADGLDLVIDFDKSQGSRIYNARTGEFFVDFFGVIKWRFVT